MTKPWEIFREERAFTIALVHQRVSPFGGAESVVHRLACEFLAHGHHVHVIAAQWTDPIPGVVYHRIPMLTISPWLKILSFHRNVRKFLRNRHFDVVHGFDRTFPVDVYHAGDGSHRAYLAHACRGLSPCGRLLLYLQPRNLLLLWMEKRLLMNPALGTVIANSEMARRDLLSHYRLVPQKIVVIPNDIELAKCQPPSSLEEREAAKRELALDDKDTIPLFLGRTALAQVHRYSIRSMAEKILDVYSKNLQGGQQAPNRRLGYVSQENEQTFEMQIFYNAAIPTFLASCIHAVQVPDSFATVGLRTNFFYRYGEMDISDWKKLYAVTPKFLPHCYPGFFVHGKRVPVVNDLITRSIFASRFLWASDVPNRKIFYGWNPNAFPSRLFIHLRKTHSGTRSLIACEFHEKKDWAGKDLETIDVVIAISSAIKKILVDKGIAEEKIIVAHDGVDLSRYDALRAIPKKYLRAQLNLPGEGTLLMFTGHLYQDRGAETLIKTLRYLSWDVRLVFVGGNSKDREHLRALVEREKLEQRVLFVGEEPHGKIASYQMAADVLMIPYSTNLPTKNWCSPMKCFEYMASGVPIVASDLPAFHEIGKSQEDIVFVRPDDSQALAKGIETVLSNRSFSAKIAESALRKVRSFTWEARAKRIVEFCKSVPTGGRR